MIKGAKKSWAVQKRSLTRSIGVTYITYENKLVKKKEYRSGKVNYDKFI
jgi:hypothetical protein